MKLRFVFLFVGIACLVACAGKKKVSTDRVVSSEFSDHLDATLPVDPAIIVGELDNGFRYVIRQNKKPENRAEFRLTVDVGSILEEENEQGLAHFAEHMAFNGTKNFPKQDLVEYLESIGLDFGPDLNAYTSFDETVYMLQVPTDDTEKMDKGFNGKTYSVNGLDIDF